MSDHDVPIGTVMPTDTGARRGTLGRFLDRLTKLTLVVALVAGAVVMDAPEAEALPGHCYSKSHLYVPLNQLPASLGTVVLWVAGADECGIKRATHRINLWDSKTFEKAYQKGQLLCLSVAQSVYTPKPWSWAYMWWKATNFCKGDRPWSYVYVY